MERALHALVREGHAVHRGSDGAADPPEVLGQPRHLHVLQRDELEAPELVLLEERDAGFGGGVVRRDDRGLPPADRHHHGGGVARRGDGEQLPQPSENFAGELLEQPLRRLVRLALLLVLVLLPLQLQQLRLRRGQLLLQAVPLERSGAVAVRRRLGALAGRLAARLGLRVGRGSAVGRWVWVSVGSTEENGGEAAQGS